MIKRIISILCCAALLTSPLSVTVVAAPLPPVTISFSDNNIKELTDAGITVQINENAQGGIVKGEVDHDGDGASLKSTHIADTNYTSIYSATRVTFETPLPAETNYRISAWVYVPENGNKDVAGKETLIGPGVLVNGRSDSNEYKYPTSAEEAGSVVYDQWINTVFETPAFGDEIKFIEFRFYTNSENTHPEVWYIDDISVTSLGSPASLEVQDLPGLKDIYKDYFLLGTAGSPSELVGKRLELINRHFNAFTFGNEMKPESMQKVEGTFTFDTVNGMIGALKENNISIIGHTLLWHSQSPEWMWSDKDKAKARLEKHIEEVLSNTGKDLVAIDVVNEAFTNSTTGKPWREDLRTDEGWYTALGPDFIEIAFQKADEVRKAIGRPDLKLYYNDFNLNETNKSQDVYVG